MVDSTNLPDVDINAITTDLNGKADVDLTNVNNVGYIKMAGASMPSSKYINLTLGASGSTYTAPADGYIVLRKNTTAVSQFIEYDSNGVYINSWTPYADGNLAFCQAIKKGSTFKIGYNAGGSTSIFRFIYAVGSESEAS